jgi:lipopolysaccharide export system permease protein
VPCLHKYWLKEFSKLFFIIQFVILVLFIFIEYLSMMDKFLSSDISLLGALWYVLLEIPFMFVQVTPASILLANIFVFGLMNKNNELLALKSSGISIYSIIKPSIFSGIVVMISMVIIGEIIVPISMIKAHDIEYNIIRQKKNIPLDKKDVWIKSGNKLIRFDYYNPLKQAVSGITILSMGIGFQPESRLDALKGFYREGIWVFEHVIQQTYNKTTDDYDVSNYERKKIDLDVRPEDIGQMVKKSEEMSFFELKKYVNKIKNEGYDATGYIVDLNGKIAFPFICIIMALVGAATGMKSFTKESIPKAVTIGIVISFFYWFFYGFCMSLGYGGSIPPLIAAWTTNFLFFCFGSLYLFNSE